MCMHTYIAFLDVRRSRRVSFVQFCSGFLSAARSVALSTSILTSHTRWLAGPSRSKRRNFFSASHNIKTPSSTRRRREEKRDRIKKQQKLAWRLGPATAAARDLLRNFRQNKLSSKKKELSRKVIDRMTECLVRPDLTTQFQTQPHRETLRLCGFSRSARMAGEASLKKSKKKSSNTLTLAGAPQSHSAHMCVAREFTSKPINHSTHLNSRWTISGFSSPLITAHKVVAVVFRLAH